MAWGELPPEYNARVHGPYDPARYYGKADTAFGQVKLGELTAWLGRRNKTPMAVGQAVGRAWWRWNHKYSQPLRSGLSAPMQIIAGCMLFFYTINYGKMKKHRFYKYH